MSRLDTIIFAEPNVVAKLAAVLVALREGAEKTT